MMNLFILVVFLLAGFLSQPARAWDGVSDIPGKCVSGCDPAPAPVFDDPCANGACDAPAPPLPPPGPDPEELRRQAEIEAQQQPLRDAQNLNAEGNAAYNRRDFSDAVALYQRALDLNPDDIVIAENLRKARELSERAARDRASAGKINEMISDFSHTQTNNAVAAQETGSFGFVAATGSSEPVNFTDFGMTEQKVHEIIENDRKEYKSQIQRLMNQIKDIKVPPPENPLKIHEGYILGLNDPKSDVASKYGDTVSPFSGLKIDTANIFATGDKNSFTRELMRGLSDNLSVGEHTTLDTGTGAELVKQLQGAHFNRLMAHSNGATVTEALIRSDVIHVDELNILGGDRSLSNGAGLQELIDSGKVKRMVVWYNPYDPIPYGTVVPQALKAMAKPYDNQFINPLLRSLEAKMLGGNEGGDAVVEYRLLKGEKYVESSQGFDIRNKWAGHDLLNAYLPNIKQYFVP